MTTLSKLFLPEKSYYERAIGFLSIEVVQFLTLNFALAAFQLLYLFLRFDYLNASVPFYYTKYWGETQLAPKHMLFTIPMLTGTNLLLATFFYYNIRKYYLRYGEKMTLLVTTLANTALTVLLVRMIFIASTPFEPFVNPLVLSLTPIFILSFLGAYLITPKVIEFAYRYGIVTDPARHSHPGMLKDQPVARGGGIAYALTFTLLSLIFVKITPITIVLIVSSLVLAGIGLIDDYQNTNNTKLKFFENPMVRLALLLGLVTATATFGIRIDYINDPFNGIVDFNTFTLHIAGYTLPWFAVIFTSLWIVWVINVLSWSNGVDGQYVGIIGIASLVIALLALRFDVIEASHLSLAKMAVISAGAAFGLTKYTWYPSKIMWGFGAVTAGFIIAALSILVGAKVAVGALVILVPFFDGIVTFIRRIIQKKNPLKGDRGHLHHLLRDHGWGFRRISMFYWVTTAFFGLVGILTADKDALLLILTIAGFVFFCIAALNLWVLFFSKTRKYTVFSRFSRK